MKTVIERCISGVSGFVRPAAANTSKTSSVAIAVETICRMAAVRIALRLRQPAALVSLFRNVDHACLGVRE